MERCVDIGVRPDVARAELERILASPEFKASNPLDQSGLLPGPLLAAYEAGQLWNRLNWHMQQAWLAGGQHHELACQAFGELARMVRNAVWSSIWAVLSNAWRKVPNLPRLR